MPCLLGLRCQFFSVRSVTLSPEATKCGMVRDMWLEPVTIMLREGVGGMSFALAAPPALATLAAMIPGSMPAESEAFRSQPICGQSETYPYSKAVELLPGISDLL